VKITKRQLRRIIKEEKQKIIQENILQGAMDKVSDFFTGEKTVRGVPPEEAAEDLKHAVAQFIASDLQALASSGKKSTEAEYNKVVESSIVKAHKIVDEVKSQVPVNITRKS